MKYDHLIDVKGLCCSGPMQVLTKEFKKYSSGEVALVVSDKSSMLNDIPAYCRMTDRELIKHEEEKGLYHFWIKK